jgi:hypothetical protein
MRPSGVGLGPGRADRFTAGPTMPVVLPSGFETV